MPQRIAATFALTAFAMCLLLGLRADNPFSTIILRSLMAMVGTYIVGLILGTIAQKMLDESLSAEEKRLRNLQPELTLKTDK